jgi:ATP-dependent Clp protease ATP-binding subunit ClpC
MNNLFTTSAKNVLMLAQEQAKKFNHHALGTEHLLLALSLEKEGVAGVTLRELGVAPTDVVEEIERLTGYGEAVVAPGSTGYLPYSPKAKQVLDVARVEAQQAQTVKIGTEHLLLALLRDDDIVASRILMNLGLSLSKTRQLLLQKMGVDVATAKKRAKVKKAANVQEGTPTLNQLARDLTQ